MQCNFSSEYFHFTRGFILVWLCYHGCGALYGNITTIAVSTTMYGNFSYFAFYCFGIALMHLLVLLYKYIKLFRCSPNI